MKKEETNRVVYVDHELDLNELPIDHELDLEERPIDPIVLTMLKIMFPKYF